MIAGLRKTHPVIISAVGCIVGTLFLAAMWVRPNPNFSASPLTTPSPLPSGKRIIDGAFLGSEFPVQTWLIQVREGYRLVLKTEADMQIPDILLYNSHQKDMTTQLPADATLIGAISPGHRQGFNLDPKAGDTFIMYSLARQQIVSRLQLTKASPL